jgi:hypothetical protein
MRLAPLYLIVIERIVSELSLDNLNVIENSLDRFTKQRDDIVSQIYRTMRFLATAMILVFLLEIKAVSFNGVFWGLNLNADESELIFGLLLLGNLIALLFATAMMKMFMIEFVLKSYFYLRGEGHKLFVAGIAHRFFAFTFGLIAEQRAIGLSKKITIPSHINHALTIILLPLTYILAYLAVLFIALRGFWRHIHPSLPSSLPSSVHQSLISLVTSNNVCVSNVNTSEFSFFLPHQPQFWYLLLLFMFNLLTLSVYAFVFLPLLRPPATKADMGRLTAEKAYRLWDGAGRPSGRDLEIWLIAERQIRVLYNRG